MHDYMHNDSIQEIIFIYETVLEGESWPKKYFTYVTAEARITAIMNYLLKEKLNVSCFEQAKMIMDDNFIDRYRLHEVVKAAKRIPEMLPGEYWHLAWYAFPEERMSEDELIIKVYDDVLDGRRRTFPSGYFSNDFKSEHKAKICFRHLCEDVLKLDKDGIIENFDNSNGIKILGRYKLRIVLSVIYASLSQLLMSSYPDIYK